MKIVVFSYSPEHEINSQKIYEYLKKHTNFKIIIDNDYTDNRSEKFKSYPLNQKIIISNKNYLNLDEILKQIQIFLKN